VLNPANFSYVYWTGCIFYVIPRVQHTFEVVTIFTSSEQYSNVCTMVRKPQGLQVTWERMGEDRDTFTHITI